MTTKYLDDVKWRLAVVVRPLIGQIDKDAKRRAARLEKQKLLRLQPDRTTGVGHRRGTGGLGSSLSPAAAPLQSLLHCRHCGKQVAEHRNRNCITTDVQMSSPIITSATELYSDIIIYFASLPFDSCG